MVVHDLKTWSMYFNAVESGLKTFEVRINDRNFMPGDNLVLREYDPKTNTYSGRILILKVNYVCDLLYPMNDHVGMSIEKVDEIS